jgi:hypothetical protein
VLLHSFEVAHWAPLSLRPHELFTHTLGGRQSPLDVHALRHLLPLQRNGLHGTGSGATQVPKEEHVDGGV